MSALHTTNFWVNEMKTEIGEVEKMGLAAGLDHELVEWGWKLYYRVANWLIIENIMYERSEFLRECENQFLTLENSDF